MVKNEIRLRNCIWQSWASYLIIKLRTTVWSCSNLWIGQHILGHFSSKRPPRVCWRMKRARKYWYRIFSPELQMRRDADHFSSTAVIISGMARGGGGGGFRTMAMQHPRGRIGAYWRTGPSKEASFFLPPCANEKWCLSIEFFAFLSVCNMKRNEPTCNISSAAPQFHGQNGHLFGHALHGWVEFPRIEENKGFRIKIVLLFSMWRDVLEGGWFKSNEKFNGLRLVFAACWTPFRENLSQRSIIKNRENLQWSAVRVTPSGSEFLKNRGRYHKMVLGHHRGIS